MKRHREPQSLPRAAWPPGALKAVDELNATLDRLNPSPSAPVTSGNQNVCWLCHQPGHYAFECPQRGDTP